jgi:hypothetical protein
MLKFQSLLSVKSLEVFASLLRPLQVVRMSHVADAPISTADLPRGMLSSPSPEVCRLCPVHLS